MTRRFFSGLLAASTAGIASMRDAVQHKFLKRSYETKHNLERKERFVRNGISVGINGASAPIRVVIDDVGGRMWEPLLMVMVPVQGGGSFSFLLKSVRGLDASIPLRMTFGSKRPFKVTSVSETFDHDPRTRDNGGSWDGGEQHVTRLPGSPHEERKKYPVYYA